MCARAVAPPHPPSPPSGGLHWRHPQRPHLTDRHHRHLLHLQLMGRSELLGQRHTEGHHDGELGCAAWIYSCSQCHAYGAVPCRADAAVRACVRAWLAGGRASSPLLQGCIISRTRPPPRSCSTASTTPGCPCRSLSSCTTHSSRAGCLSSSSASLARGISPVRACTHAYACCASQRCGTSAHSHTRRFDMYGVGVCRLSRQPDSDQAGVGRELGLGGAPHASLASLASLAYSCSQPLSVPAPALAQPRMLPTIVGSSTVDGSAGPGSECRHWLACRHSPAS